MADFLIEIGCEEIPARMIDSAREELAKRVSDLLQRERLVKHQAAVIAFSTPRRLAVLARNVEAQQADVKEQLVGPAIKFAYKDGNPTSAAEAFARKAGIEISKLERVTNPKGEYIAATVVRKGLSAAELLAEALPKELSALYWAKNMYWRDGKPERFVRPVRWIVGLLDGEVLSLEYAGVRSGKKSRGHRILDAHDVTISSPAAYYDELKSSKVIADPAEREKQIRKALDAATCTIAGARWREDAALLSTVINLTEFPGVILGNFDPAFLSLPEEVLVTVMRDHQKYFAVESANGKIAPHFLAVLNSEGDDNGIIRHGNERVLRARFNDAQFFWKTDQKIPLADRVEMLRNVTFQKDLGSYWSKTQRVQAINAALLKELENRGAVHSLVASAAVVQRATMLSKTDLTTELVKEFTELQGIVGGLYAKAQGEEQGVADAVYDHYRPESSDDPVPRSMEGALVSIADKADSIAGMFALGLQPSGSKDPYALRRQANGIVRILAEKKLSLSVSDTFAHALHAYKGDPVIGKFAEREKLHIKRRVESHTGTKSESKSEIHLPATEWEAATRVEIDDFMKDRITFYLTETLRIRYDIVNAVLEAGHDDISNAVDRCNAVVEMLGSDEFTSVLAAFKRIKNILRQADKQGDQPNFDFLPFHDEVEADLFNEMQAAARLFRPAVQSRRYVAAFKELSKLRSPIDRYFDRVLVMSPETDVRAARLGFLAMLRDNFTGIADLSEIVTEKS